MQRMKGQGNTVPNGPKEQSYPSFQNYTNPMTSSMAATSDPYMSSYYMTSPYQAFGVGDGTWSNGSEPMQTYLGGYGGQVGFDTHSAIDGVFNGGNYGGFNGPAPQFNYGFHGNGDFNAWGGSDVRAGAKPYDEYYQRNVYQEDHSVKALEHGVQEITLHDPKAVHELPKDVNGYPIEVSGIGNNKIPVDDGTPHSVDGYSLGGGNQSKKSLSWASVASQPAKILPSKRRDKVVLSSIVPGRHMDIGTWDSKNGGPKPVAPPPAPRPAWEPLRSGSRSTTSTTYSTPPPRTPPQAALMQEATLPYEFEQPSQPISIPIQQNVSPQQVQQPPKSPQVSPQPQQHIAPNPHPVYSSSPPKGPSSDDVCEAPEPTPTDDFVAQQDPSDIPEEEPCSTVDNTYNPTEFELSPENARFFVIKSYSEDDIHRSIKYQIWCSTEHGNKRLDNAFREQERIGPIYLLFSVNGSGHFCGIAQMVSSVDYNSSSSVWAQDKWKGQFQVKWIYVKDVPNNTLRHIRLENNENKPVTNSRDTQEVPRDKGKQVLTIIHAFRHSTSIFDDFIHYEKRQEETEFRRYQHHSYPDQQGGEEVHRKEVKEHRNGYRGGYEHRGGYHRDYHRDYRDNRDHRDYHHRDYYRGGSSGGGRGHRGGHYHHHHHRGGGGGRMPNQYS